MRRINTVSPSGTAVGEMPDFYEVPPKIFKQVVAGGEEWKLFYFCKHHTVGRMMKRQQAVVEVMQRVVRSSRQRRDQMRLRSEKE